MALIYASAVNRRMNALHKKNSVDYPPSAHSHISSQHSHNGHEIVHCKQRSNEERVVGGQQQQQQQSRESSLDIGHDRKRSAPPQIANRGGANAQQQQLANSNTTANGINGNSNNGSNANLDSPLTMQKQQQPQQQLRQQHKKSGEHQKQHQQQQPAGRACRKTTVSNDGQLFRPSPELLAHHHNQHRHQPRRKISTPVMAQSVNGTLTMGAGGGGGGGGGRFADGGRFGKGGGGGNNGKKSHHKAMTAMAHSRDSPSSGCSSFEVDEEEGSPPLYGGPKGLLASFGRAIRRRSVSADNVVFRRRHGTNSSLDSSDNGSPAAASGGGGRKSSAFQKMKERLNKWKLSG